jgi:hypothetical protein
VEIAEEVADPSPVLRCDEACNPLVRPLSEPPETLMALPELESAKQKVVSDNNLDCWVAKLNNQSELNFVRVFV